MYDLTKRRILYSRDVIFNEEQHGIQKEKIETEIPSIEIFHPEDSHSEEDDDRVSNPETTVRRSTREKRPPNLYGEWTSVANNDENEPASAREALLSSDREHWMAAMQQEMDSIHDNDVYDLVELPEGR